MARYRDMPPFADPVRRPGGIRPPQFSIDKMRQEMLGIPGQVGQFARNVPAGIAHLPFDMTAGMMDLANLGANAAVPGQPFSTTNRSQAIDWAAQRGLTPHEPTGADMPGYLAGGLISPFAWGKGAQLTGKGVDAGLRGLQNMQTVPQLPRNLQYLMPQARAEAFGGPKARTHNPAMMAKLEEMEAAGASPDEIFKATADFEQGVTGYLRDPYGNPMHELADTGVKLKQTPTEKGRATLGQLATFPNLFRGYPDIAQTPTRFNRMGHIEGAYDPHGNQGRGVIDAAAGPDDRFKRVLAHEGGAHGVQHREGRPGGGSPTAPNIDQLRDQLEGKLLGDQMAKIDALPPERQFDAQDRLMSAHSMGKYRPDAYNTYRRIYGEAEADNVERRLQKIQEMEAQGIPEPEIMQWLNQNPPSTTMDPLINPKHIINAGVMPEFGVPQSTRVTPSRMTTYHGTPHQFPPTEKNPLGEFDMSKIGTGEGAQAYGHGIYLAEKPGTAGSYVSGGTQSQQDIISFAQMLPEGIAGDAAINTLKAKIPDISEGEISAVMQNLENPAFRSGIKKLNQQPKESEYTEPWNAVYNDVFESVKAGNLYDVDLPDEHIARMLDWDAPLSEQPESIRALLDAELRKYQEGIGASDNYMQREILTGADGGKIYRELSRKYGAEGLSNRLREAGIPGLKYYDQGSRFRTGETFLEEYGGKWQAGMANKQAGTALNKKFDTKAEAQAWLDEQTAIKNTRNFVMFDPSIANIMRRNGMPAPGQPAEAALDQLAKRRRRMVK